VCQRALIWYATGESRELGALGGADSWARDINSSGEVVGVRTSHRAVNTASFWSPDAAVGGMLELPYNAGQLLPRLSVTCGPLARASRSASTLDVRRLSG
jgi:uncharacterized membrane protein